MKEEQKQMKIESNSTTIVCNDGFRVTLQRTLRIPEDGKAHGLPASMGTFQVRRVQDYLSRVPSAWKDHGGVFVCMHQREAMWLSFQAGNKPSAIKVAAGKMSIANRVTNDRPFDQLIMHGRSSHTGPRVKGRSLF